VGRINAYPPDDWGRSAPEVLLTDERIKVILPLIELDAEAAGTYFINAIAAFPEHRHGGIGLDVVAFPPMMPHECIPCGGNLILMTRPTH